MRKTVGVIGAGEASEADTERAFEVGKEIAGKNLVLVCGGMSGVMEAACRGAKSKGGLTIGIIPGESRTEANPYVDIPVVTGLGHARNIIVVRSSDAVIAIGGSFGTLSEIAFALRLQIPVIGLDTWDVSSEIRKAEGPKEAVDMAAGLIGVGDGRSLR